MSNMEQFLYVFDVESRNELLDAGFALLKNDEKKDIYVFANRMDMAFELADHSFVRSNILTF